MIKKTIMITSIAMIFLIGFTTNNANAADEEIIEGAIVVLGGTDVFFWEFIGTDDTSDLEVKLECGNSGDPSTTLDPFLTVIDPSGNVRDDDDSGVGPCNFFEGSKLEYMPGEVEDGCWTTILEGAFGGSSGPYTLKVELQGPGLIEQGTACVLDVVEAEKTWTKTDYNWDPICTLVDPISGDCLETRPANINNNGEVGDPNFPADDDVLADSLDPDGDGTSDVVLQVKRNGNISNMNPGAIYALTTVEILNDLEMLEVEERYDDCTDTLLELLNQKNLTRNVKVAWADDNGDITEVTERLYDPLDLGVVFVGDVDDSSATVKINDSSILEEGNTVYVLVKFDDKLRNEVFADLADLDCVNDELVTSTIAGLEFVSNPDATLRFTEAS